MMPDELRDDPLLRALAVLPVPDPDPARAATVRARCRAVLARRRPGRPTATSIAGAFSWRVLEPALIGGACALYLAEIVRRAAALLGF